MKKYLEIIRQSKLFAGVDAPEAEAMLRCLGARSVSYGKGAYILQAGEHADAVGILLAGSACIVHESFWGNRNIVAKLCPGQLFAEAFACTPGAILNMSVVTETPSVALLLDVRRVLATCSSACSFHTRVIRNLLADIAGKNLYFYEKLTHMGQRTTRQKLLSYLSAQALRQGSAVFEIPYNRQELADYLAVDRSAMSNELCKLRDEGILAFRNNHFELLRHALF
ncbi:MAG: Crp/Fnr family transcriptional regulator [Clostridia bacterium]|nr:Crp/Fnr family transcriptional regulator [Clostridia bacterium]